MSEESSITMVTETYLIETNKKILERHRRLTGKQVWIGTTRTIDAVIPHVDSIGNSGNKIEDLIEKAVHLMCKIVWEQPFEDGNRRTGIISGSIKYIMFNNNSNANMINSGSCAWHQNDNIEYVSNHEFGHYAGMIHQSGSTSHTMMHSACDVGYAVIRSGDITQINGWY